MAVNKKTIKNTEEVVNETNKEQIAENAETSVKESPATQSSISLEDIQAMMAKFQSTIESLSSELKEEKAKNEKLAEAIKESTLDNKEGDTESSFKAKEVQDNTSNTTERLLEILGNRKSDKEIVIVHNRELLGGLSTAIQLTGLTINFHTLGEQRVLSWQQFEECVSKYRKWFDKEIILLAPEFADVAERYNVSCLKREGHAVVTKGDLVNIYKKSERELEDYMNSLTEADRDFICSYWLGKCYENDAKYRVRSKVELLNRISNKGVFDNLLAQMNFDSIRH